MTSLLVIVITIILNVSITLFILNRYAFSLTEEICKMMDNNLSAMKVTTDATFEVRSQVFKELEKFRKDVNNHNQL